MSIRQDQTDTGQYCAVDDVARYIEPRDDTKDTFDDTTDIPASEVKKFIEKWSARFERRTGQSFGESQVIDETHDHDRLYYWLSGHPITVMKRNIITPLERREDHAPGDPDGEPGPLRRVPAQHRSQDRPHGDTEDHQEEKVHRHYRLPTAMSKASRTISRFRSPATSVKVLP
jgi:hypothetical protein